MTNIDVDIQVATTFSPLPSEVQMTTWARAALAEQTKDCEVTLRIVDEAEITELNNTYRKKNKPTNVLSFPMDVPDDIDINPLGDIIICAPVVKQEAHDQGKSFEAHFAHMVVHGVLHLLGYDHITPEQADIMEPLEIKILATLQFSNPYEVKQP